MVGLFEGKVALITGGATGIGKAVTKLFAEEGAGVVINYHQSKREAEELVRLLGKEHCSYQADVGKRKHVQEMFNYIIKTRGRLDLIVNCAGLLVRTQFYDVSQDELEQVFRTNYMGPFWIAQTTSEWMIKHGGSIVNVCTNSVPRTRSNHHYRDSKLALAGLTQTLALDLAPTVRVNAVAPGYTDTRMARYANNLEEKEMVEKQIPLGRTNKPEEIAKVVRFLCSDAAINITGQVVTIDGGYSLNH